MTCTHVRWLEEALTKAGFPETFRGAAWSANCREWVYFDVRLDIPRIVREFAIPDCVEVHENSDPRSGLEEGLVCRTCKDAVMGVISGTKNRFP